jgi:hypothetical protein
LAKTSQAKARGSTITTTIEIMKSILLLRPLLTALHAQGGMVMEQALQRFPKFGAFRISLRMQPAECGILYSG